ncbi:MAG: folylpolyglutamate synthase/dihydrofolate synthase family protein [Lachnospiraceae bacterium]|nr:folylpolyglutamate synthase/dihydrofolate synthase family protein [Lachnospiraceae bacterium]
MTIEEAKTFLAGIHTGEIHLALDRIQELLRRLGNPQDQVPCIHIAGTNGKGSVLAYISTALTEAGYRTGRYSSPVVYEYGEQFQIDGRKIREETFVSLTEEIAGKVRQMEQDGWIRPSGFELETTLAFLYFAREKCDISVVECGMGGRDDATNVISHPLATVFSSISLDHTAFLGPTLADIAEVKAGIMRPGVPVITSQQDPEVMEVLEREAKRNKAPFLYADSRRASSLNIHDGSLSYLYFPLGGKESYERDNRGSLSVYSAEKEHGAAAATDAHLYKNAEGASAWRESADEEASSSQDSMHAIAVTVRLPGLCQIVNSLTALETLRALKSTRFSLTDEQILKGLADAQWPGRFTRIFIQPDFLVDGAHNPGAAQELRSSLDLYYPGKHFIFIIGMFKDKDHDNVLRPLAPRADRIFTIETPGSPRALSARQMAEKVACFNTHVQPCSTLGEAVEKAFQAAGEDDVILSFGSLSNIAGITRLVQIWPGHEHK